MAWENVRPLAELISAAESEMVYAVQQACKEHTERVKRIERNHSLAQDFIGEGFKVEPLERWATLETIAVDLGDKPQEDSRARAEFAEKLRFLRGKLGKLEIFDKDPDPDRDEWVKLTLGSYSTNGVMITYRDKIPEGSKCRVQVVEQVYKSRRLVCS